MPFAERDDSSWERDVKRTLLVGDPNSGKSFSLRTWPGPQEVLAYPGEKGSSSIASVSDDGKPVRVVRYAADGDIADWAAVVKEMKEATRSALEAKPRTFAGDGLHKLYQCFLHEATFGASSRGNDFDPKLYGVATTRFGQYLDLVMRSPVEHIVFTVWGALEKDDPDERGATPSRHIFPDLPGQAAKRVMGEFSLVLYANKDASGKYIWQTKPMGKVWGAGSKLPPSISARIPLTVEQDWGKLSKLIFDGAAGK
jgi:hypothetical protein